MKVSRFSTVVLILISAFTLAIIILWQLAPRPSFIVGIGSLADLSGFLALAMIAATGVMMLFKKSLTAWMGKPERLWWLHIALAGAGGVFLGVHVALFLAFPLSLPVFLGYVATGAALFVWLTGSIYFQAVRSSMFYHGLLSIGAIFLMVLHTIGAGSNIPMELSGLSLALTAVVVLVGIAWKLVKVSKAEGLGSA